MHYLRRWAGVLAALVVVLATVLAVPASAGVPASEPSCNTTARYDWSGNCWVSNYSSDPDRISDFTTGIQTVLAYNWSTFDDPGPIDGYYGSKSHRGVRAFQSLKKLKADGIVGTNTWRALLWDVGAVTLVVGGFYYYDLVRASSWKLKEYSATRQWYVVSPRRGNIWVRMDRSRA